MTCHQCNAPLLDATAYCLLCGQATEAPTCGLGERADVETAREMQRVDRSRVSLTLSTVPQCHSRSF